MISIPQFDLCGLIDILLYGISFLIMPSIHQPKALSMVRFDPLTPADPALDCELVSFVCCYMMLQ